MTHYVFTSRSLQACINKASSDAWFLNPSIPADGSWRVLEVGCPAAQFIIHSEDDAYTPRIVIMDNGQGPFGDVPPNALPAVVQRLHRVAQQAQRPPLHLPREWAEYRVNNLVAFFVLPEHFGKSLRWVMEINRRSTGVHYDLIFWKMTRTEDKVPLQAYVPDHTELNRILSDWDGAVEEARSRFHGMPRPLSTEALQNAIDLEAVTHAAVTRYRTYTQWLELLTDEQNRFLKHPSAHAVKLRGPAGSGKTLALELKLLNELYAARERGENLRILFATHSWSIAVQVDEALRSLDESGALPEVDVLPLVAIAQDRLPSERTGRGFSLLGEDSLGGKKLQLEKIANIVESVRQGDWLAMRSRVSREFTLRVEAPPNSLERNSLVWDLMNEFASVLSANGILPGLNAERRYLSIQRTPWMMPLQSEVEKKFVLRVYTAYVASLKVDGLLTTDQLINDYHNYLETFAWNLRRGEEGYDLLFVDELHLFSEQERLVLHYLTRSADQYPRLFMALDPRQSPNEVYAGFAGGKVSSGESGEAERSLGAVEAYDLAAVHRFSPEILALVRHVNSMYPALDLGPDWKLDLSSVDSKTEHGSAPSLRRHADLHAEIDAVWEEAVAANNSISGRVAVILLDPMLLDQFEERATERRVAVSMIRGRDDVENLRYRRKSIVLSAAEYVGGLQFEFVICAGFVDSRVGIANVGYQLRRFLSLLYLAISRSSGVVTIHVNELLGGVPPVLESAVATGVLKQG